MKISEHRIFFKYLFILAALIIAVGSLVVSNHLVKQLKEEEKNKIRIWAEATKEFASSDEVISGNLIIQIIESNTTIPVIQYDKHEDYYTSINIVLPELGDQEFLKKKVEEFAQKHVPIMLEDDDFEQYVYYDDSHTLKRLRMFPYIQLGIMTIFIFISILAITSTMRMEQDKLWVGLSKETAHQLGTPLSSLLAWIEYLKMKDVDTSIVSNMEKDIDRLQTITERFSKIGSKTVLEKKDVKEVLLQNISYLERRISKKVQFSINMPESPVWVNINEPLFSWVIENLTKNGVDAMEGIGRITFTLLDKKDSIQIDISDTGKGMSKSKFKTVFNPGYSTKARGWGLGLSLAKRIVESYHKGKIYVANSDVNIGTTFRIELKK